MLLPLLYSLFFGHYIYTYFYSPSTTTFNDMSSFIEKQQYREDQLRDECNLRYYKIKDKPTTYNNIISSVKDIISYIEYPRLMIKSVDNIHVDSIEKLKNVSMIQDNIHKNIVYKDITYSIINTDPTWSVQLKDNTHIISDIN